MLPLPQMALDLIRCAPRIVGREPVFGTRAAGFTNWALAKRELDARLAGTVAPWHVHDLRRTVATGMARIGIPLTTIEKVLNHISGSFGGIVGVYQHHDFVNEMRQALDWWAECVRALVEGTERKVVPLHSAG